MAPAQPVVLGRSPHWQRCADALLLLAGLVVVLAGLRGLGRSGRNVAGFLALLAACLASPAYRRCWWDRAVRLWGDLARYRSGGGRTPWSAVLVFAVVPAAVLCLWNDDTIGSGDTWPVVPAACSLVTDGDWELSEVIEMAPRSECPPDGRGLPRFLVRMPTGVYSSYPAGMVAFAAPVAAAARLLGADLHDVRVHRRLEKWTAAWVAALSVGLFLLLALHLARPAPALVTTALFAAGSVMLSTCGQGLWQHGGIIFWLLLALLIEFRRASRPWPAGTVLQGVACAMMLACRPSAALLIGAFGLWVFFRAPARALFLGAATAIAYAPWACLYLSEYGHWLGPSVFQAGAASWTADVSLSLAGILVSPSHGLLVYQPWVLLALVGWRRNRSVPSDDAGAVPGGWAWFCVAAVVLHVTLIAAWRCWWGGHCYGSRLLAEIVPPLGLLCVRPVAALWHHRSGRAVVLGLLGVSFFLHGAAVYGRADYWSGDMKIEEHPDLLWSWSRAPFLAPWQRR